MASEVDICNLALGHLGDSATVASLDPPEGSAQAEHCARFYPIARDSLLEMHAWGFATRRVQLAVLESNVQQWAYCYAQPNGVLNILALLPSSAHDDYSAGGGYTPQASSCEVDENGAAVIYTNQAHALLRYTGLVTDTTRFSPLFVAALAWHLASMLAGPVIKGDAGAAEAKRCAGMMRAYLSQAMVSDAGQRRGVPGPCVGWIEGR